MEKKKNVLILTVASTTNVIFVVIFPNRSTTQARTQQERKKVKARRVENRNRLVEPCSYLIFKSSGFKLSHLITDGYGAVTPKVHPTTV